MKIIPKVFIFAFLSAQLYAQDEIKPFKSDLNYGQVDRIQRTETYVEKLSKNFIDTKEKLGEQEKINEELKKEIESVKQSLNNNNQEKLKDLEKRLSEIETKTAKHDLDKLQQDHDQLKKEFKDLSTDYNQAKLMLSQIKLLIMADYTERFNTKGSSDNKLKGIVEEINKVQLPKPTPTATITPKPTTVTTPAPATTATPAATATISTTNNPSSEKKEESFIEKYPLPARETFCRMPENLKKFQKECLPYL